MWITEREKMFTCLAGWMQEVMEMRQWLVKVSQEASQWKEKAVHAEEEALMITRVQYFAATTELAC